MAEGKVAVVTGATSGIGRAVTIGLARAGYRLAILGRRAARLEETIDLTRLGEDRIMARKCDVTDHPAVRGFFIDKEKVTNGAFKKCYDDRTCLVSSSGSLDFLKPSLADGPVTGMTLVEGRAFCKSVGKRLPTTAEWQLAARGSEGRKYPWGNEEPAACVLGACKNSDAAPRECAPTTCLPSAICSACVDKTIDDALECATDDPSHGDDERIPIIPATGRLCTTPYTFTVELPGGIECEDPKVEAAFAFPRGTPNHRSHARVTSS